MSHKIFARTAFTYPAEMLGPQEITLEVGQVVRIIQADAAFSAATILGFNADGHVLLARPYAYASNTGTTGPTALLGCEVFDVDLSRRDRVLPFHVLDPASKGRWVSHSTPSAMLAPASMAHAVAAQMEPLPGTSTLFSYAFVAALANGDPHLFKSTAPGAVFYYLSGPEGPAKNEDGPLRLDVMKPMFLRPNECSVTVYVVRESAYKNVVLSHDAGLKLHNLVPGLKLSTDIDDSMLALMNRFNAEQRRDQ